MAKRNSVDSGLVFSTEHGRMCPACRKPTAKCACRTTSSAAKGDGIVRVSRETKGRKGKGVTLITGVALDTDNLKKLAKQLKQKCGSGGTLKQGIIEIQGDHRDVVIEELKAKGYTVKQSGGQTVKVPTESCQERIHKRDAMQSARIAELLDITQSFCEQLHIKTEKVQTQLNEDMRNFNKRLDDLYKIVVNRG